MKLGPVSYGVLAAALASYAWADDIVVEGISHNPIATSAASGGTAGNITVATDALISISTSGAAVTVDSNNTLDNSGTIENIVKDNGVAVLLRGGVSGGFVEDSTALLNIAGTGSGNFGLLVDGTAPFTGNIEFKDGSGVLVHGTDPVAVGIRTEVIGNVTLGGIINALSAGANGVVVQAPISGSLTNSGVVFLSSYASLTDYSPLQIDPVPHWGIAIGAQITNGFVNAGGTDASDTLAAVGNIQTASTAPALIIAPSVAGAGAQDFSIGLHTTDTFNQSFSVINRGTIANQENDPGLSTIGVQIGESDAGMPAHTVTLQGGFFNRGSITASSESDNFNASQASPAPTNATAIQIGNGAVLLNGGAHTGTVGTGSTVANIVLDAGASSVDDFYKNLTVVWNGEERFITAYDGDTRTATIAGFSGSSETWSTGPHASDPYTIKSAALRNDGQISGFMSGTETGIVTALAIDPFASVPSLINTGTIQAEADSTDPTISDLAAYGIRDRSGTLTDIVNRGIISATAGYKISGPTGPLDDDSQKNVAIDLSAGSAGQTIYNAGQITGDVVFGTAPMAGSVSGNQLILAGGNAGLSGNVRVTGAGTLDVHVSPQGAGGSLVTLNTRATNIDVGDRGIIVFVLTKNSLGTPIVATTGNVNIATGASTAMLAGSFLADGTYTLIDAGAGNVHFDDAATATNFNVPFIFNVSVTSDNAATVANDAKTLKLTIVRKSAAELGLKGNAAAIYDPLSAAALNDDAYGASLLSLTTAAQVQTALSTAVPDIAGGVRALAIALTDQATGVIASRQRGLITGTRGVGNEFRFWAQEFYNNVRQESTTTDPGFGGAGQGISMGAEWGSVETVRYGLGYTFFSSQETEMHPRDTKTVGDWNMLSAYAAWQTGNFYVAPQVNAGAGDMQSRRAIMSGGLFRSSYAKWQSELVAGGLTAGYVLDVGDFQVIPTLALDGMYLREGSYDEINAGGMGLSLKSQTQQSVRGFAGVIGQGNFDYDEGSFKPQLVAGYSREFLTDPATIDGTFEAAPGSPFHLVGPTLDANRVIGGMSFGYVLRNWAAGFNYDASANSGALAQSATVSISSRF